MSEKEDVQEYVDETIKSFHIRRLLEWLSRIGGSQDQRLAILDVCPSVLIPMLVSTSSVGFIIWLNILLYLLASYPLNMSATSCQPVVNINPPKFRHQTCNRYWIKELIHFQRKKRNNCCLVLVCTGLCQASGEIL